MILISHRGNINGRIKNNENKPDYIENAIKLGYNVEIDIWVIEGTFYLGHDEPQYKIILDWLSERKDKLWIHCKNISAIEVFNFIPGMYNYFWHQEDTITLTSKNFIWAYPGKQPINRSIAVMPELFNDDLDSCLGICSDYIQNYNQ
jgi:hypothetical protein